jgi:hypothetical protein
MVITPKNTHLWMIIIKLSTWLTNLFQSYGITMFNRYYKFHKDYKSFQSFFEYICIFLYIVMHNFLSQIYFKITQYKLEKIIFFLIELILLWSTILCNFLEKICSKITMVEVQTWTPLENNTMWQHFGPPYSVFSRKCTHIFEK